MTGKYYSHSHSQATNWFLLLSLVVIGTSLTVFQGEGQRNLLLITFMAASLTQLYQWRMSADVIILFGFSFTILTFPALLHQSYARWSTVLYSLMFCAFFISYSSALRSKILPIDTFIAIIRYLIYAYLAVLIVQQICVLLGLPILNISNYDPNERWKLNSLSAEPSHTARIVGILMFAFINASRIAERHYPNREISKNQNFLVWLSFFWIMITITSATAVLLIAAVVFSYFERFNMKVFISSILIITIFVVFLPGSIVERMTSLTSATLTLDYEAALQADHSGAMRIAPLLLLLNFVGISSFQDIFGHGIDTIGTFMSSYIGGVEKGFSGGGLLALWYEYGFIAFLAFTIFSLKATAALNKPSNFLFWFIIVFIAGVNNQITWLCILLLYTLKIYERAGRDQFQL